MSTDPKRPAPRRPLQKYRMADIRRAPRRETILTKGLQVAEMGDNAILEETLRQMIPDEKLSEFNSGMPGAKPRKPHPLPNRVPKGTPNFREGLLDELRLIKDRINVEGMRRNDFELRRDLQEERGANLLDDQKSGAIGGNAEPERPRKNPGQLSPKKIRGLEGLISARDKLAPNSRETISNLVIENAQTNKSDADVTIENLQMRALAIMRVLGLHEEIKQLESEMDEAAKLIEAPRPRVTGPK